MIASEIRKVLTDPRVGVPTYQFDAPENAPYPHTVYTYINDSGVLYTEGDEDIQLSEVQVMVYHKSNYNPILKNIIMVAKENGFYITNGFGRKDRDLNIYYYTLRLLKEIENGSN